MCVFVGRDRVFVGRYGCVCVRVERVGCVLRDGGTGGRHGGGCSKRWGDV